MIDAFTTGSWTSLTLNVESTTFGNSVGLLINSSLSLYTTAPNKNCQGDSDINVDFSTFVRHSGRRDDHVRVVFILEPLSEDIHVQRPQKSETTALSQSRRRFPLNSDTAVRQCELQSHA